jgi:signal transduction histidine kinase
VKQPITAVVAGSQAARRWLSARPANLSQVEALLLSIEGNGKRASAIIDRTRDLIKRAQPEKELLNLNEAIREIVELARGELTKHRITVRTALDERVELLEGDRVQLQQVILNLVMNAVEAMKVTSEGAREVNISTQAQPRVALVTVQDSGPGFAPEALDRVFDPFYTTKSAGLGLGLSICRSIIETHGGRLSAKPNPVRGATFEFSLPLRPDSSDGQVVVGST